MFFAFSNRVAKADDPVVIRATDASALPTATSCVGGPEVSVLGFRLSVIGRDGKECRLSVHGDRFCVIGYGGGGPRGK